MITAKLWLTCKKTLDDPVRKSGVFWFQGSATLSVDALMSSRLLSGWRSLWEDGLGRSWPHVNPASPVPSPGAGEAQALREQVPPIISIITYGPSGDPGPHVRGPANAMWHDPRPWHQIVFPLTTIILQIVLAIYS